MYVVAIVEHETEKTVKTFKPVATEREAERLENGVNRNLDHAHFYTEVRANGQSARDEK